MTDVTKNSARVTSTAYPSFRLFAEISLMPQASATSLTKASDL